eukprot:2329551-Rhodomonas_salina.2
MPCTPTLSPYTGPVLTREMPLPGGVGARRQRYCPTPHAQYAQYKICCRVLTRANCLYACYAMCGTAIAVVGSCYAMSGTC